MPTTYSGSLRLSLLGDGENSGTWGQITNANLGTLLETAITKRSQVSVTSSNVTLTANNGAADQSRAQVLDLIGTSTGAREVIVPSVEKTYWVWNSTSGGYSHTVKTAAGTGVVVPAGKKMLMFCDGTNVVEGLNYSTELVSKAGDTMTGALLMPDGTVGAPALAFSADTNTGLRRAASDSIQLVAGGADFGTFGPTTVTLPSLAVTAATTIGTTLAVTGASTFTGAVTCNGNATLGDNSSDTLTVNATATFAGPVSFTGNPTFTGNVSIGDNSSDAFTVTATSTFNSSATFSSTVVFSAGVTFSSTTVHVGAASFSSTITANGSSTFNGVLTAASTSSFASTATFNGNVALNGTTTVSGALTKSSAGAFAHHASSSYASAQMTISSSAPSGGSNGDIWFQI